MPDPAMPPKEQGPDQWRARIERSVAAVRRWEPLLERTPTPKPGSRLATDDLAFPAQPTSTVVWYAVTSALDHLSLGADALQAEGVRVLRPHAFHALARSALLGAAQAHWVLHGDHQQRATRSLLIVEDEAKYQLAYLKTLVADRRLMASTEAGFSEKVHADIAHLESRRREVRGQLRAAGVRGQFNSTEMIKAVARCITPADAWFRRGMHDLWMRGSAAAHARMWIVHYRDHRETPDGRAVEYTTSVEELAQVYGVPVLVLSDTLALWRAAVEPRLPPLALVPLPAPGK